MVRHIKLGWIIFVLDGLADNTRAVPQSRPNDAMFRASLRKQFNCRKREKKTNILNALDMDMSHMAALGLPIQLSEYHRRSKNELTDSLSTLDDCPTLYSRIPKDFSWSTEPPTQGTKWILSADKHATSDGHIDASGYGTIIISIRGIKLWLIVIGPASMLAANRNGWDLTKMRFQVVPIGPSDLLLVDFLK